MLTGKIIGLGSYLPPKTLTNDDLAKIVDTNDEWITERTGIKSRRVSDGIEDTSSAMASKAAKAALDDAGIDASDLDMIVVACTTPDKLFPAMSFYVQKAIGADGCTCFDVNSACPGFVTAYNIAQNFIENGVVKTALVIGSETLTNIVDYTDRGTCILFGDGAGAMVLRAGEGRKNAAILKSSTTSMECLYCETMKQPKKLSDPAFEKETYLHMNGRDVFRFVVSTLPASMQELLDREGVSAEEVDHYVFHQANKRIIEATAKKLNVPIEKFPMNIEETGNTSSASIPILLTKMKKEGVLKKGDKVMMASFGAGLNWGVNYFEY